MFERASKKLSLDQAVLTSMANEQAAAGAAGSEDADGAGSSLSGLSGGQTAAEKAKEIEELLRLGAYGVLSEDDSAARQFCEADIDQILNTRTHVIKHQADAGKVCHSPWSLLFNDDMTNQLMCSSWLLFLPVQSSLLGGMDYKKISFSSGSSSSGTIDLNDPDFWEKMLAPKPDSSSSASSSASSSGSGGGGASDSLEELFTSLSDGSAMRSYAARAATYNKLADRAEAALNAKVRPDFLSINMVITKQTNKYLTNNVSSLSCRRAASRSLTWTC